MEYKIKLDRLKRSSKGGMIFILVILLLIGVRIFLSYDNIAQLIYSAIYLFAGIILLMDGLGNTFGRAFININDGFFSIRSGLLSKKQTIYWRDIQSAEIYDKRVLFRLKDNKNKSVVISKILDENIERIKEALLEAAETKGFEIKDMTSK